ncbi:hypothetical protein PPTG_16823 [Plasmopara halstedii]|uniref:PX domain-containing protein n=1 Tax=Plasmopara halstedii TaxID=4781 RepID=A0A0P1AZV6_PLAHL|nr:hypothetical protein PPTG_16823 [Plasmopara halstedii]CEG46906.1 hypothetical protein PPTG_16823 [Plasmopara halstedii]|eukprot:XP_024583275.1 hypothetical protein PPTG_16823 [Plasmopara halstedii]
MVEPVELRGQQLEAAVDRLPDSYFAAEVLPSPIKVNNKSLYLLCETEDKAQPLDEDDILKSHDPSSNATMSCTDDELELEKLGRRRQQSNVFQQNRPQESGHSRVSSRHSTESSPSSCSDLVLSGFSMRGKEKRVMYHIDVVNHDAPLQTYTIRRSYSDFKNLYIQLTEILESRQAYYRNKAKASLPRGVVPVASEAATKEDKFERALLTFTLPPLPHAGFLTFWKRHDRSHLQSRCNSFQLLLQVVQKMPFLRESFAMQNFLSVAPCAIRDRGSSYVSLCEYGVPSINAEDEQRERKRRAQQYRRNSSASSQSTRMVEY